MGVCDPNYWQPHGRWNLGNMWEVYAVFVPVVVILP